MAPAKKIEKPLPEPTAARPGTSGTELNLRSDRQKASTAYQRAHRAEQAYRARRQATAARADWASAKEHTGQVKTHFWQAIKSAIGGVKAIPAVLRERRESQRQLEDVKKRERAAVQKKKWDEKAKKAQAEAAAAEAAAAEGAEGAEEPVAEA